MRARPRPVADRRWRDRRCSVCGAAVECCAATPSTRLVCPMACSAAGCVAAAGPGSSTGDAWPSLSPSAATAAAAGGHDSAPGIAAGMLPPSLKALAPLAAASVSALLLARPCPPGAAVRGAAGAASAAHAAAPDANEPMRRGASASWHMPSSSWDCPASGGQGWGDDEVGGSQARQQLWRQRHGISASNTHATATAPYRDRGCERTRYHHRSDQIGEDARWLGTGSRCGGPAAQVAG